MTSTLQFVDSIASAPTTRLDINDGTTYRLLAHPDFSPPPLRRAVVDRGVMGDGSDIPASAYDNRLIRARLAIESTTNDGLATALQNLNRELDRASNILKYNAGQTNPVFFRTFRAPDYALDMEYTAPRAIVDLSIVAEPFAYGLKQTAVNAATINNDPAHATNPMFKDVTGVLGDAPTPALLTVVKATNNALLTIGARGRGTPSNLTHFRQAEAMTQGTDTALATVGATFSGSGNNGSRITFATDNTLTPARLTVAGFLGSGTVDQRGVYRLLARVARNGGASTDDFEIKASMGSTGAAVPVSNLTGPQIVDLGLFSVPAGADRLDDGYSGIELLLASGASTFTLMARRTSGTGSLDVDYIFALPADEAYVNVQFGGDTASGGGGVLDGPQDAAYTKFNATTVQVASYARVGHIPDLVPNQTNRLFVIDSNLATDDKISDSLTLTVEYFPRWLYIRP